MLRTAQWSIVFGLICSCDGSSASECVWGVDELLEEVDVSAPDRESCGSFYGGDPAKIEGAVACLLEPNRNSELAVNRCVDCEILSTYVVTTNGDKLHIRMEADGFGDDVREASVERCADLQADPRDGIRCTSPKKLYACRAPL
ncbi:MAG TPA: hypothetical protein VJV78_23470 [Polyangiales bacterium]|nr:hypothetical protein [Polyangiales bacterium]